MFMLLYTASTNRGGKGGGDIMTLHAVFAESVVVEYSQPGVWLSHHKHGVGVLSPLPSQNGGDFDFLFIYIVLTLIKESSITKQAEHIGYFGLGLGLGLGWTYFESTFAVGGLPGTCFGY